MRIGTLKESYIADAALFDSRTQRIWLAVAGALLVLFPFMASDYWLYLACLVSINVASATGLNILTGYTGLVSLGQAAFMGLGAYTVAIVQARWGTPVLFNLLAGGFVAMLGGIVVGLPSLRVKGLYLAIATIAASFIAHFLFANLRLTGGTAGLTLQPATVFGVALDTSFRLYWVIVPVTLLMLLGAANLFRTRTGRAFIAIRDRDISAEVLGIPLLRYKLLSFGLSSFYAGVAGGLWAYFFRVVTPESFPLLMSIFFLAAIIVGGMGSILGSILGAVFMTMVPELLKLIVDLLPGGSELAVFLSPVRTMVFGLLIIVFLVFEPQGLAEMWRRLRRFFHLWPFRN
ncbi:branched-chain amino acid ABC transporter permease [Delftia tsuruhatensis]|uniref:branched-chain amino acid ABC transporter permease n=1 Tax=Delftia tsuruhatensis TaxID=180282 RepID=UPI002260EA3E|nr:branched-chain amino acid ABC transporter permease [Delftia tsuruhatensis]MCX7507322.1 branched-chain amino acid ABC transporter permease [Delftia tsuruhatensis]MDH0773918.1 branched-chain amino acid ABC transporter permease [Delftia tsuruhatensis]MDH1458507.1 branched-chain amino acid ABC transporter permease [Delftia tsuruhatensis]MDH1822041.1 branched-chain amino acid ABC transporter permease [Delftia tsuruhatensis]WGG11073.1 branched-chain amino acid ABC transporter permease [Delftia ts